MTDPHFQQFQRPDPVILRRPTDPVKLVAWPPIERWTVQTRLYQSRLAAKATIPAGRLLCERCGKDYANESTLAQHHRHPTACHRARAGKVRRPMTPLERRAFPELAATEDHLEVDAKRQLFGDTEEEEEDDDDDEGSEH